MKFLRNILILASLILLWEGIVVLCQLPPYILPTPTEVLQSSYQNALLIQREMLPTLVETILGLILGSLLGCFAALMMAFCRPIKLWLLPVLIMSQALPTFAIAPLLVIWLGYGMAAKIATTIIMLFFPVASAFFDGLRRTESGWLALAKTMQAKKWRVFCFIRIPAALPNLASGLRVATVVAPIGAVIGEWVGASHGLGFLILNANARMQIDLMFAALFMLVAFSLGLYFVVNKFLHWAIRWNPHHEY